MLALLNGEGVLTLGVLGGMGEEDMARTAGFTVWMLMGCCTPHCSRVSL